MFSNLGGSFGLCIGFSVITVMEVLEFLIYLCIRSAEARKSRRVTEHSTLTLVSGFSMSSPDLTSRKMAISPASCRRRNSGLVAVAITPTE